MNATRKSLLVPTLAALTFACSDVTPKPTPDDGIPPEVAANARDWPLPGRDYSNTRATTDSAINASNIARLEVAWSYPLPGSGAYGNAATTPLILGDTIYIQDLTSNVHAVDRATGEGRWKNEQNQFVIGPNGVAVGWGKVFALQGVEGVIALDAQAGTEIWRRSITQTQTDGVDIQPTVYGDRVFASSVPISLRGIYSGGDGGVLHALDEDSGEIGWTFDTIDSEDFWGNPEVNSGGGSWAPPALSPKRGRIYWAVANPAPFVGTPEFPNGTSRPGPNLYTNSVLTLEIGSGDLDWYHQVTPHDLFDRDLLFNMIAEVDGREMLVTTGKAGVVVGLDIETGQPLWRTEVGIHRNDDLEQLDGPTAIWPGTFGGVLTPPSTADGIVYVATVNAPTTLYPDRTSYIGSDLGTADGQVVAIDARDGSILWDVTVAGDPLGATTVVNDVVLTATFQGTIYALDRKTGATIHTITAPGNINGWPAIAGDLLVWPVGLATPPSLVGYRLPPSP